MHGDTNSGVAIFHADARSVYGELDEGGSSDVRRERDDSI